MSATGRFGSKSRGNLPPAKVFGTVRRDDSGGTSLFGMPPPPQLEASPSALASEGISVFGSAVTPVSPGQFFGATATANPFSSTKVPSGGGGGGKSEPPSEGLFGTAPSGGRIVFGAPSVGAGPFGKTAAAAAKSLPLFGKRPTTQRPPLFGQQPAGDGLYAAATSSSVFGTANTAAEGKAGTAGVKSRLGKRLPEPASPVDHEDGEESGVEDGDDPKDEDFDPNDVSESDEGSSSGTVASAASHQVVTRSQTESDQRHLERLTSREELQSIKAVVCEDVPQILLRKPILEKHFSKFGPVVKLSVNVARMRATVHFQNHKAARRAKTGGHLVSPKMPRIGGIFFMKTRSRRSGSSEASKDDAEPAKPRSFHVEPAKPPTRMNEREAMAVLGKPTWSDMERYEVLEARDRLLRESRPPKSWDAKLVGTCPDMCPEKERYSRSAKNQLRPFEKLDGSVHHSSVVKEYSRSSADQDVPLPHELRPPAVLKLTMDHLLCNVVSRIDDLGGSGGEAASVGDWFEYVWSATRGIRKDITQQDLANTTAVDMVEKCARFHIVCAERLVEEDQHNFNTKLNDENLTKCIQTLKHLYYDLSLEGISCPNEAEFRAYDVLLNMNDGDTLRSVQTLEKRVRASQEVGIALKLFNALCSNNYARFFKLVRHSTLLQGCLLLRYFDQMRRAALNVMVRAYCPAKVAAVGFSLSRLTSVLGFEDRDACASYCVAHGLQVEENVVSLSKGTFCAPEEAMQPTRARNLIESKRHVSWSEVINNGLLPDNPQLVYRPHDSFDAAVGRLKREAYDGSDQSTPPKTTTRAAAAAPDAEAIAEDLLTQVVGEIAREATEDAIQFEAAAEALAVELFRGLVEEESAAVARQALKEERNAEVQRRLLDEQRKAAADEILQLVVDEVAEELSDETARSMMRLVDKHLECLSFAPSLTEEILAEVVAAEAGVVAGSAMEEEERERLQAVERIRTRRLNELKRTVLLRWRHVARKAKERRETLANFPSSPSLLNLSKQAEMLSGKGLSRRKPEAGPSFESYVVANEVSDGFAEKFVLEKLDLAESIGRNLVRESSFRFVPWKLIVCLPGFGDDESSLGRGICQVIRRKLEDGTGDGGSFLARRSMIAENGKVFAYAVRAVDAAAVSEEICASVKKRQDYLCGASALLFVHVPEAAEPLAAAKERLAGLVENVPRRPPVPLFVLTTANGNEDDALGSLGATRFRDLGMVSDVGAARISTDIFDVGSLLSIHRSLPWLAERYPHRQIEDVRRRLTACPLRELVRVKAMGAVERVEPHRDPRAIVRLFNATVEHVVRVFDDVSMLHTISWPVSEVPSGEALPVYWNDQSYIDAVRRELNSLLLPTFPDTSKSSRRSAVEAVKSYFVREVKKSYLSFSPVTAAKLESLLDAASRGVEPLPWREIVLVLVEYKLQGLKSVDPFSPFDREMVVGYFETKFQPPKQERRSESTTAHAKSSPPVKVETVAKEKPGLHELIEEEKVRCRELELRLKEAAAAAAAAATTTPSLKRSFVEAEKMPGVIQVPVIAILSPTAALLTRAMPFVQMRLGGGAGPEKPKRPKMHEFSRSFGEEFDLPPDIDCSHSKSRLIRTLRRDVQKDLNESDIFEQKLLADG